MHMTIDFPGGKRVDADFQGHSIPTDQPEHGGGENSAPAPFDLFLASIGTCSGIYVLSFCQQRALPTDGINIVQHMSRNPETGMLDCIDLDIQLPEGFPDKYRRPLVRAAGQCAVKRHLESPPRLNVRTSKPSESEEPC